jgi:hypothetical protein
VEAVLRERPDFSSGAWVASLPFRHAADAERLHADLTAAGLPP